MHRYFRKRLGIVGWRRGAGDRKRQKTGDSQGQCQRTKLVRNVVASHVEGVPEERENRRGKRSQEHGPHRRTNVFCISTSMRDVDDTSRME